MSFLTDSERFGELSTRGMYHDLLDHLYIELPPSNDNGGFLSRNTEVGTN